MSRGWGSDPNSKARARLGAPRVHRCTWEDEMQLKDKTVLITGGAQDAGEEPGEEG